MTVRAGCATLENMAKRLARLELALGVLLVAAPWLFGYADVAAARWSNIIIGTFMFLISLWQLFGEPPRRF